MIELARSNNLKVHVRICKAVKPKKKDGRSKPIDDVSMFLS